MPPSATATSVSDPPERFYRPWPGGRSSGHCPYGGASCGGGRCTGGRCTGGPCGGGACGGGACGGGPCGGDGCGGGGYFPASGLGGGASWTPIRRRRSRTMNGNATWLPGDADGPIESRTACSKRGDSSGTGSAPRARGVGYCEAAGHADRDGASGGGGGGSGRCGGGGLRRPRRHAMIGKMSSIDPPRASAAALKDSSSMPFASAN